MWRSLPRLPMVERLDISALLLMPLCEVYSWGLPLSHVKELSWPGLTLGPPKAIVAAIAM